MLTGPSERSAVFAAERPHAVDPSVKSVAWRPALIELRRLGMIENIVMTDHLFISYSRVDAGDFAILLTNALEAGSPSYPVWLDARDVAPRATWDSDEQVDEAIQTCRAVLFVMSDDSVSVGSGCKNEWVRASSYKKPVILLRLHRGTEAPFRFRSEPFVDFCGGFAAALARLRGLLDDLSLADDDDGIDESNRGRYGKLLPGLAAKVLTAGLPHCQGFGA